MPTPRSEPRHSRAAWAVPLIALALSVATMVADPNPLRLLRAATFDQFQRWQPRDYLAPRVRVVDIDDESLRRLGQWPWPRDQVAELVNGIERLGPASIALDIMFSEPDRTTPAALLKDQVVPDSAARFLANLPDHDEVLAHALSNGNVALGFSLISGTQAGAGEPASDDGLRLKAGYLLQGGDAVGHVPGFASAIGNMEKLQHAAAGQGAMTFVPGPDGVVRQVPLLMDLDGRLVPLMDLRFSPRGGVIPGVEVHAQALARASIPSRRSSTTLPKRALGSMRGTSSASTPRYLRAVGEARSFATTIRATRPPSTTA